MTKRQQVVKFAKLNSLHAKGYADSGLVIISNKDYSKSQCFDGWDEAYAFLLANGAGGLFQ